MKHSRDEIYMYLFDTICLNTPTDNCICSDPHKNPRSCISFCTCLKKKRIWIWNIHTYFSTTYICLIDFFFKILVLIAGFICGTDDNGILTIYTGTKIFGNLNGFLWKFNILNMCSWNKIYHLNFSFKSWRQLTLVTVGAEKSRLAFADVRK